MKYPNIKKILLIRLRSMGDLLTITPCTRAVKDTYPDCHLSVLVEEGFSDIFLNNQFVDNIIVAKKKDKSFFNQLLFIYRVRREKFDMILNLHGGPRSCMIIMFSGAQYRVGGLQKAHHFNWIFNIRVPPFNEVLGTNKPQHIVNRHLATLLCAGIKGCDSKLIFNVAKNDRQYVLDMLSDLGRSVKPLISLHFPVSSRTKKMSAQKVAQIADSLIDRFSVFVVFTGDRSEGEHNKIICSKMKHRAYNLGGKTTVGQLAALYEESVLFIGLDSGPSHIAAAVGTNVISLFGSTSVSTWHPWTDKLTIIQKDYDCIGCGRNDCTEASYPKCIEDITTDEIMDAIVNNTVLLNQIEKYNGYDNCEKTTVKSKGKVSTK